MDFKVIVDTLASLASFIAITSVMVGWYRSVRKPLKIKRVVIHRNHDSSTFILVIQNRQQYPVTINRAYCYKRKIFEVMKKNGGYPEYAERLSSSEELFINTNTFEVPASANTDIRIKASGAPEVPKSLLLSLDTSHGYHELWCKDITVVDIGKAEAYSVVYQDEYRSKAAAKFAYYWKILIELTTVFKERR